LNELLKHENWDDRKCGFPKIRISDHGVISPIGSERNNSAKCDWFHWNREIMVRDFQFNLKSRAFLRSLFSSFGLLLHSNAVDCLIRTLFANIFIYFKMFFYFFLLSQVFLQLN